MVCFPSFTANRNNGGVTVYQPAKYRFPQFQVLIAALPAFRYLSHFSADVFLWLCVSMVVLLFVC